MTALVDHYVTLGVPRYADAETIRAAYVAHIKTCHPDSASTKEAADRFHALQRAYECLRIPEQRARHDEEIAAHQSFQLRKIGRVRRRLRKIDRRPRIAIPGATPVPHWRAAATVATCGSIILSGCYLLLR